MSDPGANPPTRAFGMAVSENYGSSIDRKRIPFRQVLARIGRGERATDLAREYGVTKSAISHCARRHGRGVKHNASFGRVLDGTKLTIMQRAEIVARASDGVPRRALAAEYGVDVSRIYQCIKQARAHQ